MIAFAAVSLILPNPRSKLPKPGTGLAGKGSKLPTPKTPKTQPKNIGRKV